MPDEPKPTLKQRRDVADYLYPEHGVPSTRPPPSPSVTERIAKHAANVVSLKTIVGVVVLLLSGGFGAALWTSTLARTSDVSIANEEVRRELSAIGKLENTQALRTQRLEDAIAVQARDTAEMKALLLLMTKPQNPPAIRVKSDR